jgi:hypothetical protein
LTYAADEVIGAWRNGSTARAVTWNEISEEDEQ